jgi:hypothetical protein
MEFDALQDLVWIITRNKVKNIEILGNPGEDNRSEDLYDAISKAKVVTDEEAAKRFFSTTNPKDKNYKKLKNKLVKQLVNTAFFIDLNQPSYSDRASAYYNCYRDFAAACILTTKEAKKASIEIFQQVLEQAIKYEFVELVTDVTRILRLQYGRTQSDVKNHEYFSAINKIYEEKRRWQMVALDNYEELIRYYIVKQSSNEEVNKLATQYFDELFPLNEKVNTASYIMNTTMIGVIKYFSEGDWASAMTLIENQFALLQPKITTGAGQLAGLAMNKLFCLIQLRRFDNNEGEKVVEEIFSYCNEGGFNWFRTFEIYFQYCVYARQYAEALKVYQKVSSHTSFKLQSAAQKDVWRLYKGYLHLLGELKQLPQTEVNNICGPYKQAKYLNEFEIIDKDRAGMNIPLLLLPILFCLAEGEYQEYGRSVPALDIYRKRYLNNNMNKRSTAFMNMLLALDRKMYETERSEKKIQKELEVLRNASTETTRQSSFIEIIPYEDLWNLIKDKR